MTTREAFEKWAGKGLHLERIPTGAPFAGDYRNIVMQTRWDAWQAATDAALSAPATAPAQPAPERKPMTDDETLALFDRVKVRMLFTDAEAAPFASGVAAAEHFHGIGDKT